MVKIFLKINFYLLLLFIYILLYGFIVKGYPSLIFYLVGLTISILYLFIVFKNELKEKDKVVIVLILVISLIISSELYLFINNTFDDKKIRTYYSVIYETEGKKDFFTSGWFFKNPEGKECFYRSYFDYYSDKFSDGDIVIVDEFEGTFKVEHYNLQKVN